MYKFPGKLTSIWDVFSNFFVGEATKIAISKIKLLRMIALKKTEEKNISFHPPKFLIIFSLQTIKQKTSNLPQTVLGENA